MKKFLLRTLSLLLCLLILLSLPFTVGAEESGDFDFYEMPLSLSANAVVLLEMNTGTLLYGKNMYNEIAPASTTKMMTLLLAAESGISPEETVTLPYGLWDEFYGISISNAGLVSGEKMSFADLMACAALPSANEAASAIAHLVSGGSRASFIDAMNKRAKEIGAKHTNFVNPHGLDEEGHYSTAYDLSLIAAEGLKNETFRNLVSRSKYTLSATNVHYQRVISNTNKLMDPLSDYYTEGVVGVKTGTTYAAGRCLVSVCEWGDLTFLAVVMGSPWVDAYGNTLAGNAAFADTKLLLEWAKETFTLQALSSDYETTLPVIDAKDTETILLKTKGEATALLPQNAPIDEDVTLFAESLTAPVEEDRKVGEITLSYKGQKLATFDIVTAQSAEEDKLGIFLRTVFGSPLTYILTALILLFLLLLLIRSVNRRKNRKRKRFSSPRRRLRG